MSKSAAAVQAPRAARAPSSSSPRRSPWQWLQALFSHQLRLRRGPRGLAVVLEPKAAAAAKAAPAAAGKATPSPAAKAAAKPSAQAPGADMRGELSRLLDAVPQSRTVLRHLAAIETGLRKDTQGMFLSDVALAQLQVALRQLASLSNESPTPGLVALSTRLLDAIAEQEKRIARANGAPVVSSFLVDDEQVEVAEVDVSRFEQMFEGAPGVGPVGESAKR